MSKRSVRSHEFSPLLWLVPLPFALAMCLPVDLLPLRSGPVAADRVAAAPSNEFTIGSAASAPEASPARARQLGKH